MTNVGPRIAAADCALACGIQRPLVPRVSRALDYDSSFGSEDAGIARVPRGHDAIKLIDSARHALHQVAGRADSHEVARRFFRHVVSGGFGLAHRKASQSISFKTDFHDLFSALPAQRVIHSSLDDPIKNS